MSTSIFQHGSRKLIPANLLRFCIMLGLATIATTGSSQPESTGSQTHMRDITTATSLLRSRIKELQKTPQGAELTDADIFVKGAEWALKYETKLSSVDLHQISFAVDTAYQRLTELESGAEPWSTQKGRLARGYVSKVDNSVQPYGLIIPKSYNPSIPTRLDVVLHGSSQPTGMSELRFLAGFNVEFNAGDDTANAPADHNYIELHPLGRVENCYRWSGETDVFEAIDDVCHHYNIDRSRIVLRGMSMGASGTWHLGLKHPDQFVALGPYSGYVDTHQFSETPGMNFVKVGPLPLVQEKGLHMLDSVDYAANASMVPEVAAIGEKDPFFQAHVIMGAAMKREGLQMVNIISPGTGHVQDPATWADQMGRIKVYADQGIDYGPAHIRFVTWTLKYSKCFWIKLLGLRHHYERAEIEADLKPGGLVAIKQPANITRFAISPPTKWGSVRRVTIAGLPITLPKYPTGSIISDTEFDLIGSTWRARILDLPLRSKTKLPGLQGPIDDAFTTRFLCVRGTGKPWNPAVQSWADANLKRFSYEWSRYFRGALPVKDDTQVTTDDCSRCNLILFGDPGSNLWIRKSLKSLPVHWAEGSLQCGDKTIHTGADYVPELICPSPFIAARSGRPSQSELQRYVVINSGHTFHESELNRLNYLLFPRLGDWAVFKIGANQPDSPSEPLNETLISCGYFDEEWK